MQKSGNVQKDMNQIFNSSASHTYNNNNSEQSGFVSMLSPRNLIKLFSKNTEEGFPSVSNIRNSSQYQSSSKTEQINRQFEKYLQSLGKQMQKYKKNSSKNKKITQQDLKKKRKEQIQEEIKISKIPQQYFKEWDSSEMNYTQVDQEVSQFIIDENINKDVLENQSHKSLRLRTLLVMGDSSKKKLKQKGKVLEQKQSQLQSYLDEIEVIIFNKTSKYPDKYLNYLMNLKHSDLEVDEVIGKVNRTRKVFQNKQKLISEKYCKVLRLQRKKHNLEAIKALMASIYELYQFKLQSRKQISKQKIQNVGNKTNTTNVNYFRSHSEISKLQKINSIKQTFLNLQQMHTRIRNKKFELICTQLKKTLSTALTNMYSRESWLKNDLPRDSLMLSRMGIQVQPQIIDPNEEGNLNNSYLNISILDQSYCVGGISNSKKEIGGFGIEQFKKDQGKLQKDWKEYCCQYLTSNAKLEEEQQQILQLVQRLTLKFIITFHHDIEDYICFIYNSKKVNLKMFPSHQERIIFVQPKIFNKISKVLFESLGTVANFCFIFKELPTVYKRIFSIIEEEIVKIIQSRKLSEYDMIQKNLITYDDLNSIVSSLDYWSQFANETSDKIQQQDEDEEEGQAINRAIAQFEDSIQKRKEKVLQSYVNNIHQCALTSELKQAIQKQDFQSISIPLKYFSILNEIINYGQNKSSQQCANLGKLNDVQQSICYPSSFVNDLNLDFETKFPKSFSIFKIIDKKLIIQGKQYKICLSFLLLCSYIEVYIKTKIDFPSLSANIQQRICEVIGFYIWYCKKITFTSYQGSNHQNRNNRLSNCNLSKKSILSLSMLHNICQLLSKFMDIFNLTSKPKKVAKVESDLKVIRQDCLKEIPMIPFLQIQKQISCLYESRLKTRKEIPTKESMKIIQVLDQSRRDIQSFFEMGMVKKLMENSTKIVNKNYFGYLSNMQARGKQQIKWFFPTLKDTIGDIFADQMANLEKYFKI